ncbi:bifunctional lysylphosphatidylglycerol synthetase/lysine--tRNA ligase LysX [uncultured Friedmanniella sp.]|uniref:bifunctional lysylphosphatidylglycerol synthetase/lysine--tRNA ligase LysX n=1 Tax=uncultured Friedmanniella sp. TaxID=335381 RepID=UPI0035C94591
MVSRLFFVGAAVLALQALAPGVFWTGVVVDVYSTVVLPVDGGTLGFAIFLAIIGGALARRKQTAWVVALVLCGLSLVGDLLAVVTLVIGATGDQVDYASLPLLARFAFNLPALGFLTACLVVYRAEFTARRPPGGLRKALVALVAGLAVSFGVAMALVSIFPNQLAGPRGRSVWILRRIVVVIFGSDNDVDPPAVNAPPSWINTVVGVLVGLSLLVALVALMRSQRRAAAMSADDEPRVRALVAESGQDSLAYFATRRDKSVVFAPSGRAAVTYRVDLGVCLASSDPLGPLDHWPGAITAWQELTQTYGWTPAVIGASEAGATAYARAGMRVIRLGDEAVLTTRDFQLDSRELRPVRQAVQRLERMGYRTRIRRHGQIPAAEMVQLVGLVDAWRDTETERGFSMALGRLGDPADADCLMVEALFPADRTGPGPVDDVAGLLSFVPWGSDGFSLDVMRRSPQADNGVTELMVCGLMAEGRNLGLHSVSLNFAVFRSAFEEGARIGAGPVLRVWRRLLLVASRWWQIESLYRSNVKYHPTWQPRFLCFDEARDIALVGAASGVAEGFIDLPTFLRPRLTDVSALTSGSRPVPTSVAALAVEASPARVPEQVRQRMAVRSGLLARGVDPYPPSFRPSRSTAELRLGMSASVAGRVLAVRDFGGVIFLHLQDWSGQTQLMLTHEVAGAAAMAELRQAVGRGDHVGAEGMVVLSRAGELSLEVTGWLLTAKALRPPPDHRAVARDGGLRDPETRVRQRYLDLTVSAAARSRLTARSRTIRAVRDTLHELGYLEVETPVLQTVHGGANARPFRTHINAYDLDLYLRIAPELYLKRLMVGGVDRLFEIGRNFRNEGADATHNPEFTMLEAYQAYGDYTTMRTVAQQLVSTAARAVSGSPVVHGTDQQGRSHEVDLGEPWPVVTVHDAIGAAAGVPVTADTSPAELAALARRIGLDLDPRSSRGAVVLELYEHLVEARTVRPTFYTDFPAEVSPLTRAHRDDPRLAERWDLVAFGAEIGTAYSELVDPVEQRARLTAQSLQAAGGDPEAMELDEDFLVALEHAMPPSGGLGMGMDRLVMLLTQASIRETIAFPLVRPRRRDEGR